MFSYRHAFHAGSHADVLKHTVLMVALQHLTQKDTALSVLDTHAGTGLYRLDGDFASTSGEAEQGIGRLLAAPEARLAPALQDYVRLVRSFNGGRKVRNYPGSPAILHSLLRPQDSLRLFELLPVDARALAGNMQQLQELQQLPAGHADAPVTPSVPSDPSAVPADAPAPDAPPPTPRRSAPRMQLQVLNEDGFVGIKRFLPPPSRRGLVLCDPSYEIKTDYAKVVTLAEDGLRRFATGCYAVWYPILGRQEAHDLPRRLKAVAERAGKNWLHATLTVKAGRQHSGLPGSGMFLINPPFVLKAALAPVLPQLVELLGQDQNATFVLESAGLG